MFENDGNDGLMSDAGWIALIGAGYARRSRQRQEQGLEYQRQQLNLLREHQGLPPIPAPQPQYQGRDFIGGFILFTFSYVIAIVLMAFIWPKGAIYMIYLPIIAVLQVVLWVVQILPISG